MPLYFHVPYPCGNILMSASTYLAEYVPFYLKQTGCHQLA